MIQYTYGKRLLGLSILFLPLDEDIILFLLLLFCMQHKGVESHHLAEGTAGVAVTLMQCTLQVGAGIRNLFRMPVMARILFGKDTVGSLTSTK